MGCVPIFIYGKPFILLSPRGRGWVRGKFANRKMVKKEIISYHYLCGTTKIFNPDGKIGFKELNELSKKRTIE